MTMIKSQAVAGLSRRDVFTTAAAGALVYSFSIPLTRRGAQAATQTSVGAFVRIGSDESILILVGVSEMGQGVSSGIAQVLAEELMVDWTKVRVQTAQANSVYANPILHTQGTFGSFAMRGYFAAMRKAGAVVREMLKLAASTALNVPVSGLTAANGVVTVTGTTTGLTYGALAAAAGQQTPPSNSPLLGAGQYIGVSVPRADIPVKTTGQAVFGIDVRMPGMVYAAVQNSPIVGGTLPAGFSPAVPSGALAVIPLDTAVAVVANDTYTAFRLARSVSVNWQVPAGNSAISSASILSDATQLMSTGEVQTAETVNWAQGALLSATKAYDQTFTLPYLAHACMEVLNCTALVTPTTCTIWAPTQAQSATVATAAKLTGLPTSAITVNTTFLGGGLGRKIEQDFISQAVRIAMAMQGTPVKLTWQREQDFGSDQYRSMALVRARAGVDSSGNVTAWWTRLVAPSYAFQHGGSTGIDFIAIAGATGIPYSFGNRLVEYVRHPSPVPVGSWRSIGASINTFVTESVVDELAAMAGSDPASFRQKLLAGSPRGLAVLNAALALSGWGTPTVAGRARGLAFCATDNSFVALVAEITAPTAGTMQVVTISVVVDVGLAVNPDGVTAQIEGGVVHGMSAALWGQVTLSAGRPNVRNFDTYRMMRMRDMPVIQVQLINGNPSSLGGAGEISVPPVAPALANAWATLTGQRIRTLPMFPRSTGSGGSSGGGSGGGSESEGSATSGSGTSGAGTSGSGTSSSRSGSGKRTTGGESEDD